MIILNIIKFKWNFPCNSRWCQDMKLVTLWKVVFLCPNLYIKISNSNFSHQPNHIFLPFTWINIKTLFFPSKIFIYLYYCKKSHKMLVNFRLFLCLIGVLWNSCKPNSIKLFTDSSFSSISPYPFNSTSSYLLVDILAKTNSWMFSNSYFGILFS